MSYLFPCALVENFADARLASDLSVEEEDKWSVSNTGHLTISLDRNIYRNDRRSLKVVTNSSSVADEILKGVDGTVVTNRFFNNPFVDDIKDVSFYTNVMMWFRANYNLDDVDVYAKLRGAATTSMMFGNTYTEADKWSLLDKYADMSARTDLEQFAISLNEDAGVTTAYINNVCLAKKAISNARILQEIEGSTYIEATEEYDWMNGLKFFIRDLNTKWGMYTISGYYAGDDYREVAEQLRAMETIGLNTHDMLRFPFLKFSTVFDSARVKTYYLLHETHASNDRSNRFVKIGEPVVIGDLSIQANRAKVKTIEFSATLYRFGGV